MTLFSSLKAMFIDYLRLFVYTGFPSCYNVFVRLRPRSCIVKSAISSDFNDTKNPDLQDVTHAFLGWGSREGDSS